VHGRIDTLVNNAGGQYITPLEHISAKGWEAVINTNLTGGFLVARECYVQSMQQHGGAIVNIVADMWGSMPNMGHSGAARAGMVSFTETAAAEWARSGVRVNAVAPGYIASSGMDHYPAEAGPMLREMRNTVPLGRFGTEAETSAAVVFLLSPAAAFISGDVLRVDGGRPQGTHGLAHAAARRRGAAARSREALRRLSPCRGAEGISRMTVFASSWNAQGDVAQRRREAMLARIAELRGLQERAAAASGQVQTRVRQARPAAAARARRPAARRGNALSAALLPGRLSSGHQGPGCLGARRRHRGGDRLCQRRALHGGGQRFGHRRRGDPGHGA
jgi:hypothetical protein